MTKVKCNKCGKWIDINKAYIELVHAIAVGTSVYAFCSEKCSKESEE